MLPVPFIGFHKDKYTPPPGKIQPSGSFSRRRIVFCPGLYYNKNWPFPPAGRHVLPALFPSRPGGKILQENEVFPWLFIMCCWR